MTEFASANPVRDQNKFVYSQVLKVAKKGLKSRDAVLRGNCAAISWPEYADFPVQECRFTMGGRQTRAVVLNPSAGQLATWSIQACQSMDFGNSGKTAQRKRAICAVELLKRVLSGNGGYFVIAGALYRHGEWTVFRNAVPVKVTGLVMPTGSVATGQKLDLAVSGEVASTQGFDTMSGADYVDYLRFGRVTTETGKIVDESSMTWPDLVGQTYREAYSRDGYYLMRTFLCARTYEFRLPMSCPRLPLSLPGAAKEL